MSHDSTNFWNLALWSQALGRYRLYQPGRRLYHLPPRLYQPGRRLYQPPRLYQPGRRLYQPPGGPPIGPPIGPPGGPPGGRPPGDPPGGPPGGSPGAASAGSEVVSAPPTTTPTITACDHLPRLRRNSRRSCSAGSSSRGSVIASSRCSLSWSVILVLLITGFSEAPLAWEPPISRLPPPVRHRLPVVAPRRRSGRKSAGSECASRCSASSAPPKHS